jgi:hypothetical protein
MRWFRLLMVLIGGVDSRLEEWFRKIAQTIMISVIVRF